MLPEGFPFNQFFIVMPQVTCLSFISGSRLTIVHCLRNWEQYRNNVAADILFPGLQNKVKKLHQDLRLFRQKIVLDSQNDSKSTKRTVQRSDYLFREFLGKENETFGELSKQEMAKALRLFYASDRKQIVRIPKGRH